MCVSLRVLGGPSSHELGDHSVHDMRAGGGNTRASLPTTSCSREDQGSNRSQVNELLAVWPLLVPRITSVPSIDDIADAVVRATARAGAAPAVNASPASVATPQSAPPTPAETVQKSAGGRSSTGAIGASGPTHRVREGTLIDTVLTNRLDGGSADFFCGLRACEIKALQWKHISFTERRLSVRRSKTPAGWRDPSLNDVSLQALQELHNRASNLGFTKPEHYLFPSHSLRKELDPTRPMTSWRTAWRSLRRAAGLPQVRFHDGRHTALTRLAEKGVPDWVIRAQFGHVSTQMMAIYSHVRRKALDEAAKALEPNAAPQVPPTPDPIGPTTTQPDEGVTSHVTSHEPAARSNVLELVKKSGAPCRTRTCDLLVRSQVDSSTLRSGVPCPRARTHRR
jgi:integrase-like protein